MDNRANTHAPVDCLPASGGPEHHPSPQPVVPEKDPDEEAGRRVPRFGPALLVGVAIWVAILLLMIT